MSVWIAKFLGPLILALSVPMILTPTRLTNITTQFLEDSPLILISGMLAMTAGLAIVNTHNVWVLHWSVIVTLFGWVLVIGGALRVMAPQLVQRLGANMMQYQFLTRVAGVFWAGLGAFLTVKGYV